MKNIQLIIILLALVIISVIGLNLKLKKDSFAVGTTTNNCYRMIMDGNNTALKNRLDFIEKSGVTGSNMANLLKLMDTNIYSQYDGNGNVTSFPGNPCIFPKTSHSTYNVNNKRCTQMGFTASNLIGDCLYEITTESNLNSFIPISSNLYNSKTSVEQASIQSRTQEINAANAANEIARTSNMEVTGQNAVATNQYNAAVAQNSSLSTTLQGLQGNYNARLVQGATAQASVTANSNTYSSRSNVANSLERNDRPLTYSQQVGGAGVVYPAEPGNTFEFKCENGYISSFKVRSGSIIDAIQATCGGNPNSPQYGGINSSQYGGGGGGESSILSTNNAGFSSITASSTADNNYVQSFKARDMYNTESANWGTPQSARNQTLSCAPGKKIVGITGREAILSTHRNQGVKYLGKLGVICEA